MAKVKKALSDWAVANQAVLLARAARELDTMKSISLVFSLALPVLAAAPVMRAADDDLSNEFRFTLSPHHTIQGDFTGSGELGYYWNPEADYETYTLMWGLTYGPARWVQLTAGLRGLYTDNEASADKFEVRPFAGVKLFLPNELNWHIYNNTRFEYRDTENLDTDDWSGYGRIRSRFGVEFPLASRGHPWGPKTWYGLADVEPYYRFDKSTIDPVLVRGGVGYVVNDRMHIELIYHAQFSRPADGGSLEHTENIFRLNLKIGLREGLLRRLQNPSNDD